MGIIERKKKTLGSVAKNGDGGMIVNKHTFFLPYTFWFASFISFGLLGQETKIVVTCVSGSLPKTIRIGRSILFSESAPKIYGLSGNLKHFFSWPYLQKCRLPLHNARPTLNKICFPLLDSIKKRGSAEYVISVRL